MRLHELAYQFDIGLIGNLNNTIGKSPDIA